MINLLPRPIKMPFWAYKLAIVTLWFFKTIQITLFYNAISIDAYHIMASVFCCDLEKWGTNNGNKW